MQAFPLIFSFCTALVLSLLGFMTVAVTLPELIAAWSLSNTQAGWLGGIYFAGYVVAVPLLTSLTDRIDARRIYLCSATVAGLASLGFALFADGFWSGLMLRFLAGAGLGGTYMPGLKALTDQLSEHSRNRGVTYYTAVFALGTALSYFVGGEMAALLSWRWAFGVAAIGCVAALLIIAAVLPARAPDPAKRPQTRTLDFRPVLKNRQAMGYTLAFFGYAWEVFGYRVWIVAFLVFAQDRQPDDDYILSPAIIATIVALCGVLTNMALGELAAHIRRRRMLTVVALASMACGILVGFSVGLDYEITLFLCVAFGMLTSGRNSPTTGGTVAAAEENLRGTTMALHASVGYVGGIIGPLLAGAAIDLAGGMDQPHAWGFAFIAIAIGPVISAAALVFLVRERP